MTPNRLIHEQSPYLLQHAHNPVDWYPWGEEAFARARAEQKPIFLSIGYSTCHWCHVMERESFENEAIAEILNRSFVSIKLDREERPDVDRVYMTFVQAATGSGGWPMSVWLTPELKPFYGGTYFPPDNRYGRPGFASVLTQLAEAWQNQREKVIDSSIQLTTQLESYTQVEPAATPFELAALDSCYHSFRRSFDSAYGGFGSAPKFPRPSVLHFLFRYYHRTGEEDARDMALKTLREMAHGGMNDQLGGGFHRYSVDERWFVPHFEKMLYDQAQLAESYLDAFQITHDAFHAETARAIFDYVLRDMTHPEGGFYSAEDADSAEDPERPKHKSEGAFYLWTHSELLRLAGPAFTEAAGARPHGNVDHDPHNEFAGKNILYRHGDIGGFAAARHALLAARGQRPRPHLDDKILTSWNALMISAFARGARVLSEPRYLAAAERAFGFVQNNMRAPHLLRRWRNGSAAIDAFLDDYAALALAALDLYETTFKTSYLETAQELAGQMRGLFEDVEHGGFFSSPASHSDLVLRMKEDYDGAEPSGNSLAVELLLRLALHTGNEDYRASATRAFQAFSSRINSQSPTIPRLMSALMLAAAEPSEITFSGPAEPLFDEFLRHFMPFSTSKWPVRDGNAAATLCSGFVCHPPAATVEELRELLN
ncbi:MAG: thioredoxin domain-containing protein [Acidobacteria bacterium]|nr:thioredoxin domain-containing protein [Acidobacteriota bacterium]